MLKYSKITVCAPRFFFWSWLSKLLFFTIHFWYWMWDCPPIFSRILNSGKWIFASFLTNQKNIICLVSGKICYWEFVKLCNEKLIWPVHNIASRSHKFTNFLFAICRWGKERPLNIRLVIQNVRLPTHDIIWRWGKERPLNTPLLIQNVGLPTHDIDCVPGVEDSKVPRRKKIQVSNKQIHVQ